LLFLRIELIYIAEIKKYYTFAVLLIIYKMHLTNKEKETLFKKHGGTAKNTGSTEGQVALFTERINYLTGHLKINKKDFVTQRSLLKLVGKRRSLLDYLKNTNITRYREVIKDLDIRK
jgi:small subunit ribosomal protein S15